MEEVDEIIILSLKGLVDIEDDVRSIKEFEPSETFKAVLACLRKIKPEAELPEEMPKGMSAKVQACSNLAQAIKDMGYKRDLGYHQLLYPQENDTRSILSFLTSRLPRDEEDSSAASQSATGAAGFITAVTEEMKAQQKRTWTPSFAASVAHTACRPAETYHLRTWKVEGPFLSQTVQRTRQQAQEEVDDIRKHQDFITRQVPVRQDVAPSVLEHNYALFTEAKELEEEWNTVGLQSGLNKWQFRNKKKAHISKQMAEHIRYNLGESEAAFAKSYQEMLERQRAAQRAMASKASRFQNLVEYSVQETVSQKETDEDIEERRRAELAKLEERLNELKSRIEAVREDMAAMASNAKQLEAQTIEERKQFKELEDEYRIQKKIFTELLPDAENNIRMLQEISQQSAKVLLELANEWEEHRAPMIEAYRKLKESKVGKPDDTKRMLDEIKKMREEMKKLREMIEQRDLRYKEMLDAYSRLPKNINRSIYTKRILDIVKQVKKQKVDISKILLDTRNLKKEINSNLDALNRSYSYTTEVVYADAKKDPVAKQTYKDLVNLHEMFESLSTTIKETGDAKNSVLDIERKLEQLSEKAGDLNVDRVKADLEEVRAENTAMIERIRSGKPAQSADPLGES